MIRLIRPALLAGVAVLCAAPAHAQASAALDPMTCRPPSREPVGLQIGTRTRDAEATEMVRAAARNAGVDSARGLVFVAPGMGVRIYGGNVPQPVLDGLATELLDRALSHQTARDRRPTMLLRLDPLPLPACGSRARREMRPRLLNRAQTARMLGDLIGHIRREVFSNETLLLRMVLTRDGEMVGAEVIDSESPASWEEGVLEVAQRMRFSTASIDGVPQDVVVVLPVTLQPAPMPTEARPPR